MKDFVLLSEGGSMPEGEEEQRRIMDAWGAWYAALGAAVKDPGKPMGASRSIAPDGAISDGRGTVNGYIILKAESLDDAVAMAKDCPVLQYGSSIVVYETLDVM